MAGGAGVGEGAGDELGGTGADAGVDAGNEVGVLGELVPWLDVSPQAIAAINRVKATAQMSGDFTISPVSDSSASCSLLLRGCWFNPNSGEHRISSVPRPSPPQSEPDQAHHHAKDRQVGR